MAGAQQAYERASTTSPTVLGAIAAGVIGLVVLLVISCCGGAPLTKAECYGATSAP